MSTLSVIIPVYNCRKYLESCVASVTAVNACCGSMPVGEIILVDDGSTDGSSRLCDELAAAAGSGSPAIRVIHQANRGVSAARNEGLRVATGTFVLFADADDTLDAQKLAELMEIVSQDATIDMAIFGLTFDYYAGERIYRRDTMCPPVEGKKTYDECTALLAALYNKNALSPLWNKLIRRSIIEDAGICLREDMFLYEDLEFSLRVLARCGVIYLCAEPIYRYRQPPDEGNAGRRLKRIAHIPELLDKIEAALTPICDAPDILLSLHLVLAREKISCATRDETDMVCADFRSWVDTHGLCEAIQNREYGMMLYNGRSTELLIRRSKTRIRHRAANLVKKTIGDFRKW